MNLSEFMTLLGILLLMNGGISALGATADSVGITVGVCVLGLASLVCAGAIALLKRILQR